MFSVTLTSYQIYPSLGAETDNSKPKDTKSDSNSDSNSKGEGNSNDDTMSKEDDSKSNDDDKSKDEIISKENDDYKGEDISSTSADNPSIPSIYDVINPTPTIDTSTKPNTTTTSATTSQQQQLIKRLYLMRFDIALMVIIGV